jgi:DNA-binding transcriptional ArsR family regulator
LTRGIDICTVVQMTSAAPTGDVVALDACDARVVDADKVADAQARIPAVEETDRLAEWFRVFGDPTRTRILYALLEVGELCVCDLAAAVRSTETTTSHALRWLRGAGVVRSRRSGRRIFYAIDDEHVRLLLDLGREHLRHRGGTR